jgi:hypothetical protein
LREKFVPEIERKVWMSAAEAGDEVVLEGLDGSFGPVATVEASGGELVFNSFVGHEVFE